MIPYKISQIMNNNFKNDFHDNNNVKIRSNI